MKKELEDRFELSRMTTAKILGWDDWYKKQKDDENRLRQNQIDNKMDENDWITHKRLLLAKLIVIFFSVIILVGLGIGLLLVI
jgi:hypothetical protein